MLAKGQRFESMDLYINKKTLVFQPCDLKRVDTSDLMHVLSPTRGIITYICIKCIYNMSYTRREA